MGPVSSEFPTSQAETLYLRGSDSYVSKNALTTGLLNAVALVILVASGNRRESVGLRRKKAKS